MYSYVLAKSRIFLLRTVEFGFGYVAKILNPSLEAEEQNRVEVPSYFSNRDDLFYKTPPGYFDKNFKFLFLRITFGYGHIETNEKEFLPHKPSGLSAVF